LSVRKDENVLSALCEKCNNDWKPYGLGNTALPTSGFIICPNCKHKQWSVWYDTETARKLEQKKLGLLEDGENTKRINDLEHKVILLEKEIELEKKKRELFEVQLEQISDWADDREQDFLIIENFAEDIEEDKKFKEDNR